MRQVVPVRDGVKTLGYIVVFARDPRMTAGSSSARARSASLSIPSAVTRS
jgi:hypothetical protein